MTKRFQNNLPLAFSDIDLTMTPCFMLFPVCDALATEGFIPAADNEQLQNVRLAFESGAIDYKTFVVDALVRAAALVKDRKIEEVSHIVGKYIDEEVELFPWVTPTFEEIKDKGGLITIVSAEPDFVTRPMAKLFGAEHISTQLDTNADGTYSGQVALALGSSQKGTLVRARIEQNGNPVVYVFGDSVGDIGMLDLASPRQNAFCINPDKGLREHALGTGMTIVNDPYGPGSLIS